MPGQETENSCGATLLDGKTARFAQLLIADLW
jgi:hypothetical protein